MHFFKSQWCPNTSSCSSSNYKLASACRAALPISQFLDRKNFWPLFSRILENKHLSLNIHWKYSSIRTFWYLTTLGNFTYYVDLHVDLALIVRLKPAITITNISCYNLILWSEFLNDSTYWAEIRSQVA